MSLVSPSDRHTLRFAHSKGNGSAFKCVLHRSANPAARSSPSSSGRV